MDASIDRRLTPRNIYRWFSGGFNPVDSHLAIDIKMKGMTLIRFWKEILSPVLPKEALAMLDGAKENRSRSLSNIMNRTATSGVQSPLYQAFAKGFDSTFLLHLSVSWLEMLTGHDFDMVMFSGSIDAFEDMCLAEDPAVVPAIREHLESLRKSDSSDDEYQRQSFVCSARMAWLTVYAFLGNGMEQSKACRLKGSSGYAVNSLFMRYCQNTFGRYVPSVLTTRECEVCTQALSARNYVVRSENVEQYLFDLMDRSGKILISAPAGTGKTELVRQILLRCNDAGRYSRIGYVQYGIGLNASLRRSFKALKEIPDTDIMDRVLEVLDKAYSGRTLLVIDDVRVNPDDDWAALSRSGCDILVTSSLRELEGFECFPLGMMGTGGTRKLLEIHSDSILTDTEEEIRTLRDRVNGHTLAIILMGKIMKANTMTVAELNRTIKDNGYDDLRVMRYGGSECFLNIMQQVFLPSLTDGTSKRLLCLFSTFGSEKKRLESLTGLLWDIEPDRTKLTELLYRSHLCGWLELNANGYSMQPVIADALLPACGHIEEYPLLLERMAQLFDCREEMLILKPDAIPAANAVACFAEKGDSIPDRILRGALIYSWYTSNWPLMGRLAQICKKSGERNTCFAGKYCYQVYRIENGTRFDSEQLLTELIADAADVDPGDGTIAAVICAIASSAGWDAEARFCEFLLPVIGRLPTGIYRGIALTNYVMWPLISKGDFAETESILHQAKDMDPDGRYSVFQESLRLLSAHINSEKGDYSSAIADMEYLLECRPMAFDTESVLLLVAYSWLSQYCRLDGRVEKAKEYALLAVQAYDGLSDAEKSKADISVLYNLAYAYFILDRCDEAMTVNSKVTRMIENVDSPLIRRQMAAVWHQRARFYQKQGKYVQAMRAYSRTEEIGEQWEEDHYHKVVLNLCIASTLDAMKRYKEARARVCAVMPLYHKLQKEGFVLQEDLLPMLKYAADGDPEAEISAVNDESIVGMRETRMH